MKNLAKITVVAFAALSFAFTACNTKTGENVENTAESAVDAAGAELDSATTPTTGDTAVVQDQPVQDGLVDSTGTN